MARVLVARSLHEFATAADAHDVEFEFFDNSIAAGEYAALIPTVIDKVGPAEIDRLNGLRLIANFGVGYDNIDVGHARERGR